jgi:hypothetical protein
MQTKLKPIFFLATLAATAMLLYAASAARAQGPAIGLFDVSTFPSSVISISPKLGHPDKVLPMDSSRLIQNQGLEIQPAN